MLVHSVVVTNVSSSKEREVEMLSMWGSMSYKGQLCTLFAVVL